LEGPNRGSRAHNPKVADSNPAPLPTTPWSEPHFGRGLRADDLRFKLASNASRRTGGRRRVGSSGVPDEICEWQPWRVIVPFSTATVTIPKSVSCRSELTGRLGFTSRAAACFTALGYADQQVLWFGHGSELRVADGRDQGLELAASHLHSDSRCRPARNLVGWCEMIATAPVRQHMRDTCSARSGAHYGLPVEMQVADSACTPRGGNRRRAFRARFRVDACPGPAHYPRDHEPERSLPDPGYYSGGEMMPFRVSTLPKSRRSPLRTTA